MWPRRFSIARRTGNSGFIALVVLSSTTEAQERRPAAVWRLSEAPLVSIGGAGDGAEGFGRVVGAVRLSSGTIVVADGMSLELRFFSATGEPIATAGRRGSGPGEFRTMRFRRCTGDSLVVYDGAQLRLSVFSPTGRFVRSFDVLRFSGREIAPYEFECNGRGAVAFLHRSHAAPAVVGPRRPQVDITLHLPGLPAKTFGTFPASERYFLGGEEIPRPLGRITSVAVSPNAVYVGAGDEYEVVRFDLEGRRVGMIRRARRPVRVSQSHIDSFIEEQVGRGSRRLTPQAMEAFYRGLEYPVTFPAYSRLLTDPLGNLWVEDYPIPGKGTPGWSVYSADGATLASLDLPSRLQITEIGSDYVVGIWRDELDLQYVRVYRLEK